MTLSIGELADEIFGTDVPFQVHAYDGSTGGNRDADISFELKSERGLRYLVTAPGELGLARAYVQGDLEVVGVDPGDPYELLVRVKIHAGSPTSCARWGRECSCRRSCRRWSTPRAGDGWPRGSDTPRSGTPRRSHTTTT